MRWGSYLAEVFGPVIDLVYPPRCPLCGGAIAAQGGLCSGCWSELEVPGEPACSRCARPLRPGRPGALDRCAACLREPPRHSGIHAATLYNDASRKLVLMFKHGGKIALARLLGRLIAVRLPPASGGSPPLLVPVPLHRWRIWARGYNQAALLARELARAGQGELMVDALVRRRRTPSLGGLGSAERREVLRGAITARGSRRAGIAGREVILVDDVLTSGATSNACVAALLDAGALSVRIACFARVAGGRDGASGGRGEEPDPGDAAQSPPDQTKPPQNTTPGAITTPGAA